MAVDTRSLENHFISDLYTSLLHLSGVDLNTPLDASGRPVRQIVFDGAGNQTGLALSGERVIVNNYTQPIGYPDDEGGPTAWLDAFWPVGCIQLTIDDNNPQDRIYGTTWEQVAHGKFLVGVGHGCDNATPPNCYSFCPEDGDEEGNLKGLYEEPMNESSLPAHRHYPQSSPSGTIHKNWYFLMGTQGGKVTYKQDIRHSGGRSAKMFKPDATGNVYGGTMSIAGEDPTGQNQTALNNIPPNFGVYIWKRTA
tara:strand:- start:1207 stop:1962 length:756 start_codon:yes stop_codon:yes gene_type:complete